MKYQRLPISTRIIAAFFAVVFILPVGMFGIMPGPLEWVLAQVGTVLFSIVMALAAITGRSPDIAKNDENRAPPV